MKNKESFYWYLTRDNVGDFVQYLGFVGLMLLGIFLFNKKTKQNELHKLSGTFEGISRKLDPFSKIKKLRYTSMDTLEFIHLQEYNCKFPIAYKSYYEERFLKEARKGDSIELTIDKGDVKNLDINDRKIRMFSLDLNGRNFLSEKETLSSMTTTNLWLVIIGTFLLGIFGFYTWTQYKDWKRI